MKRILFLLAILMLLISSSFSKNYKKPNPLRVGNGYVEHKIKSVDIEVSFPYEQEKIKFYREKLECAKMDGNNSLIERYENELDQIDFIVQHKNSGRIVLIENEEYEKETWSFILYGNERYITNEQVKNLQYSDDSAFKEAKELFNKDMTGSLSKKKDGYYRLIGQQICDITIPYELDSEIYFFKWESLTRKIEKEYKRDRYGRITKIDEKLEHEYFYDSEYDDGSIFQLKKNTNIENIYGSDNQLIDQVKKTRTYRTRYNNFKHKTDYNIEKIYYVWKKGNLISKNTIREHGISEMRSDGEHLFVEGKLDKEIEEFEYTDHKNDYNIDLNVIVLNEVDDEDFTMEKMILDFGIKSKFLLDRGNKIKYTFDEKDRVKTITKTGYRMVKYTFNY